MTETGPPVSVAVFSTKAYDERSLTEANRSYGFDLRFFEEGLNPRTAALAAGCEVVCAFVNDDIGSDTVDRLADHHVRLIALRSAGFNHVDLQAAGRRGLVVRVCPNTRHTPSRSTAWASSCHSTARSIAPTTGCGRATSPSAGCSDSTYTARPSA